MGASAFENGGQDSEGAFDLAETGVADTWRDGEGASQHELMHNLLGNVFEPDIDCMIYDSLPVVKTKLSVLRTMYEHRSDEYYRSRALGLVSKKMKVDIDESYTYQWDSDRVTWKKAGVSD